MADPSAQSTVGLVSQIRAGDDRAFNELFGRYLTRLENLVRVRMGVQLRTRESVSDVVQEAYLEALRTFDRFAPTGPRGFYRWLAQIVEHKIVDAHRRHFGAACRDARRQVALDGGAADDAAQAKRFDSPSAVILRTESCRQVREALERLPEDYRRVIELRQFQMLSSAEVGEIMDRSPEAVRALLVRALKRLAKEIPQSERA